MLHPLIASDPKVTLGKPGMAGTRITVEHVLDELAGGLSKNSWMPTHGLHARLCRTPQRLRQAAYAPKSSTRSVRRPHEHTSRRECRAADHRAPAGGWALGHYHHCVG